MSAQGRSMLTTLLTVMGAAVVLGAARTFLRKPDDPDEREVRNGPGADEGQHSRRADLVTYGVGYGLALLLTGAAFALVHWRWASGTTALGLVFGLALAQAVVHFRCFLHIDLKRSSRDDLQLILFSTLIIALMVGGTLVVLLNLRLRMM